MTKVAIITAAGRGMGAAVARELAQHDYAIGILSPSGAPETLADIPNGFAIAGSVTNAEEMKALVDQAMEKYGRIDAVVNNTGHIPKGPLLEIPDEDWILGLDLAMLNVVRMARLVTPIMQNQGGGSIVNISTYAVFEPESLFPVSGCVRAALASFTKLYTDEYASDGIRMNNVLPGFIDSLPEKEERRARIPLGRYGTVSEIAKTVRFLLSSDASYITGQNLLVDGGITRSV